MSTPLLSAENLHTFYGESHILRGVSLALARGETVGLMGRNGMGKSTLIRSMLGIVKSRSGRVRIDGADVTNAQPFRIAQRGIAYVPEGRGIFASLRTIENLTIAERPGVDGSRHWTVERILDLFPRIRERASNMGHQLSGGEQQMLAIGRALMSKPRLLLLDEPSLGLAPLVVKLIFNAIRELNRTTGLTVLLVEQNAFQALRLAHRGYVLVNGRITMAGTGADLLARPEIRAAYLEGGHG